MSLLRARALTIAYPDCSKPAVKNLGFDISAGESVGIVGESGAGKSQTALSIMGLLPTNAVIGGSIQLDGTEIVGAPKQTLRQLRARKMSMIFQDPATALNPYLKVGTQLKRILLEHRLASRREVTNRCVEMLDRVGLPEPGKQYHAFPHQLSGGMRQRVLIAAALIGEPDLVIADEPTTALDVTVQAQILELLRGLRRELDTALLMITHDLAVISSICERVLVMNHGELIEEGSCSAVLTRPSNPHTKKLIDTVPRLGARGAQSRPELAAAETILDVNELRVSFRDRRTGRRGQFVAVEGLNMKLRSGETIAIVGESGSGKTSLARSIAGLLPGSSGRVSFVGEQLAWQVEGRPKAIRRQLQMVFQDPVSSLNPAMRVGRIIAEPLAVHMPSLGMTELNRSVSEMLDRVGLDQALRERFPHELSGGQAQRVAIARALVVKPRVLICDEALAALDGTVRGEILALLKAEKERSQLSLILITHDFGVVREISDRVIVMYKGRVCEEASNEELFSSPQHEYTKTLLAAVPTID